MSAPWLKFYPSDWRSDPALRMCSMGARGLWMEMLCVMHEATPRGFLLINGKALTVGQMAALAGCPAADAVSYLAELTEQGVLSRDGDGRIYSRRMKSDTEKEAKSRQNGLDGGNPYIRRGTVPKEQRVRPYRRSDAPQKTQRIFDKSNGRCHWCAVELTTAWSEGATNFFHVDHLLPVCDGGTNDEGNLVAACADCNHKRARLSDPTASPVSVGISSDTKAQIPEARKVPIADAIGDGKADPPALSLTDQLWTDGVNTLVSVGVREAQARSMVGKWLKDTASDAGRVHWAIGEAAIHGSGDPIPYITRVLSDRPTGPPGVGPPPRKESNNSRLLRALDEVVPDAPVQPQSFLRIA